MNKEKNNVKKELESFMSRRKFLIWTGALATGLIATGGIIGCSSAGGTTQTSATAASTSESTANSGVPWSYQKLNVDDVRKRGYEGYYKFGNPCFEAKRSISEMEPGCVGFCSSGPFALEVGI